MIRNAIRRFMYGRYGNDQLNLCLIVFYLALYLLFAATRFVPLYWLTVVLILAALFRTLSRNLTRRREENDRFLCLVDPAVRWLRLHRTIRRDKEHRYFKCPNCGQMLRVPRGKGKITVTCRGCGASFQENSRISGNSAKNRRAALGKAGRGGSFLPAGLPFCGNLCYA